MLQTHLLIDKHSSMVYTSEILRILEKKFVYCVTLCSHHLVIEEGELEVFKVKNEHNNSFRKDHKGCDYTHEDGRN